jgi:Protein of unknown function (DUF2804)
VGQVALPYRGRFGEPRPAELGALALPPQRMPSHDGLRPLKTWRYVGVYGPELMVCAAIVRIGPARQSFWAVWDRRRLFGRTRFDAGGVTLATGGLEIDDGPVRLDLELEEGPGIESICPTGESYAWTRKQGGGRAHGRAVVDGSPLAIDARSVIDDTAGYYARHTHWRWSAGVGQATNGREVAWNLVAGVNDPPSNSERTVWVDGEPSEPPPSTFTDDLSRVDGLRFNAEATRTRRDNLVLVRSRYRQPFGTFSGELPGGIALADGYGVMEEHDAWW